MNLFFRILLPIAVLAGSITLGKMLMATAPEAKRKPAKPVIPVVEVVTLFPSDYPVTLQSRGTIAPRTESTLVAEVSGRILSTAPNFKPGGQFSQGMPLITIDPADYHYAITIAKAELAQAELALEQRRAEAEQAAANWRQLGLTTPPTPLTLQQPQLKQAKAALAAAQAKLARAQRELQQTTVTAPYAGRLLEQQAETGQFVSRGTPLATLYATDVAEVRLPITDRQSRFLQLPESGIQTEVTLSSTQNATEWRGKLVRSEAAMDARTRQLYVVAEIDRPYLPDSEGHALRIGQFVTAIIHGKTLPQVYRVPRIAVRDGNEVLTVDSNHQIQHKTLEVIWQQADQLIVSAGLEPGAQLVTTALPYAPEGMKVKIANGKPQP